MISREVLGGSGLQQLSFLLLKSLGSNLCPSRSCLCCTESTGEFPHWGPAELWQRKPSHEVVSYGQESWREQEVSWKGR